MRPKTLSIGFANQHQQQIAFDAACRKGIEGTALLEKDFGVRVSYTRFGSDIESWSSFCYGLKRGFELAEYLRMKN